MSARYRLAFFNGQKFPTFDNFLLPICSSLNHLPIDHAGSRYALVSGQSVGTIVMRCIDARFKSRWMSRCCKALAAIALLPCIVLAGVDPAKADASKPMILRTAAAVRALSAEEAPRGYPVKFKAVVLFYDPHINAKNGTLFVHDETGGIFVAIPAKPILPLKEGTLLEVTGVSGAGDFAPVVDRARVRILGPSKTPRSAPLRTITQLMSGESDSQWIGVEGVVHSVVQHGNDMVFRLATSEGPISATTVKDPASDYDGLIDSTVRLRAVAASQFNQRRQLTGVHLFFPSLDDLQVLHQGPPDPFALPIGSIGHLLRFEAGRVTMARVHLRGSVTLQWPRRFICIQDASGGLCVQSSDKTSFPLGSVVDVVGFPAVVDTTPTLTDATFRPTSLHPMPLLSTAISAPDAVLGNHSGELVALEGQVVGLNSDPKEPALMIASGGLVFPAVLADSSITSDPSQWRIGSKVRVLGICIAVANPRESDDRQGPALFQSFRILMRSASDLTILESPSWWTPRHTIAILSVALLITFGVLCWAAILHRRVGQQTKLVCESEERFRHLAHHDPLTGLPNRALLHLRLDEAIGRAKMDHTCVALLMMDLDRFKQVNDSFGHDGGDQMLCETARRIAGAVRRSDTVARMGGDEFIVLVCGLYDVSEACEIAVKTLQSVSEPIMIGMHFVPISASIGLCAFPEDGGSASDLLKNADTAMYQAKAMGRNRFHRYAAEKPVDNHTGAFMLQTASSGD